MAASESASQEAACEQEHSTIWLQNHGLKAKELLLNQILPRLGFRHRQDYDPARGEHVSSVYGKGLFVQQADAAGKVYNICAKSSQLLTIEQQLKRMIELLKDRLKWLNTNSRLVFGVLAHRSVVIVLDSSTTEPIQIHPFITASQAAIKEQVTNIQNFNIIRSAGGLDSFADKLVEVSTETVQAAEQWLEKMSVTSQPLTNNISQAVSMATGTEGVDAVYLFCHGNSALRALEPLKEQLKLSPVQVHISVYMCKDKKALELYQQLAAASHAKLHLYNPVRHSPSGSRPSSSNSGTSNSSYGSTNAKRQSSPSLPREDVLAVWKELEKARDTLATLQALGMELRGELGENSMVTTTNTSMLQEECLSSTLWLKVHGLRAHELLFRDLVTSLAFQHCDGVVRTYSPGSKSMQTHRKDVEMIPETKIIGAKYCKDFVHLRWETGDLIHAHLDECTYQNYRSKVERLIDALQRRQRWLKNGSRGLFGTITEKNVVIVIDTSSSMVDQLPLVKNNLVQLMKEQLSKVNSFTVLQFSTNVTCWRQHLVPVSPQNMAAVQFWVEGLEAGGSTNTLCALRMAVAMERAEAVYLLTDGRPDQSPETILAKVQQWKQIPVHTISFNCADTKANHFLARLAAATGGRYHYYSKDITDPDGPVTFKGDDLQVLEDEESLAEDQLLRAYQLREECAKLQYKQVQNRTLWRDRIEKQLEELSKTSAAADSETTAQRWLGEHGLSARKLTLMDALGPTSIPHNPKHISVLDKHVSARVFQGILSFAHVAGNGCVTLINPMGVNLRGYESQLDQFVKDVMKEKSHLVWKKLSQDGQEKICQELGLADGEVPVIDGNQMLLKSVLEAEGVSWKEMKEELKLMDDEIALARSYQQQSVALRQEAATQSSVTKRRSSSMEPQLSHSPSVSSVSSIGTVPSISISLTPPVQKSSSKNSIVVTFVKGQRVVACDPEDGFFYPGVVQSQPRAKKCMVRFPGGRKKLVSTDEMFPNSGSVPCPALRPGECVLVRVRARNLADSDIYLPAVVGTVPDNPRSAAGLHTVTAFGGKMLICTRRAMVKLTRPKYKQVSDQLANRLQARKESLTTTIVNAYLREHVHKGLKFALAGKPNQSYTYFDTSNGGVPQAKPLSDYSVNHSPSSAEPSSPKPTPAPLHTSSPISIDHTRPSLEEPEAEHSHSRIGNDPSLPLTPPHTPLPQASTERIDQGTSPEPFLCDASTNTMPAMENKGTTTDPEKHDVSLATDHFDNSSLSQSLPCSPPTSLHSSSDHSVEKCEKSTQLNIQDLQDSFPQPSQSEPLPCSRDSSSHPSSPTPNDQLLVCDKSVILPPLLNNTEVLARWLDDGWFYRSVVVGQSPDSSKAYLLQDANGTVETIPREDIITDHDDAQHLLELGDPVVALHPSYPHSYAPGHVRGILADGLHFTVELYDGTKTLLPRYEVYSTSKEMLERAVNYITSCDEAWLAGAVIARKDADGLFHQGMVDKKVSSQQYLIQWSDGSSQVQEVTYMFKKQIRQRPLYVGDHVIALPELECWPEGARCPAIIMGAVGDKLEVQLYTSQMCLVTPELCYWITPEYYQEAVKFINREPNSITSTGNQQATK